LPRPAAFRNMARMNILLNGAVASRAAPRFAEHFGARASIAEAKDGDGAEARAAKFAAAEVLVTMAVGKDLPPMPKLRLIQLPVSGTDAVDFAAVPAGVPLCNVYEHEIGIAEYLLCGMLEWTVDLVRRNDRFRAGSWAESPRQMGPMRGELAGKTLLLIGYGFIGRATALRAKPFGVRVLALTRNPRPLEPAPDLLAGYGELDRLLPEADFVVACCPLADATKGMLGAAQFGRMKRSAVAMNVGRGPVIDEDALYAALKERRIAGGVIDTWYRYPDIARDPKVRPSKHPFHELDNVIMTPHLSGWTEGASKRRWEVMIDNIERLAAGRELLHAVRPG
jgi:phosphoglycerate dehydrogenase-like enzyme